MNRLLASLPAITAVFAVGLVGLAGAPSPARAKDEVTIDATYEISIAGWGIARATMDLGVGDGRYEASLFMKPKGVAKIVTAVRTSVSAAGRYTDGKVRPTRYRVRASEIDRPVAVDMTMRAGTVTGLSAVPPLKERPGRIPVTAAHKRDILDPLSSGLLPIGTADGRDACDNTLRIYDGWTRYDVTLYPKGRTTVATEGYSGPAVICGARWVPIAGHRPAKKEVQYLARNEALEMWVVPIPSARVAVPYRVTIGTPNGEIEIEPSRFVINGAGV